MSDRYLESVRDGSLALNSIPSGRQLPRTPPLASVRKHLDFSPEDSEEQQDANADKQRTHQDDNKENTVFEFNQTEAGDPESMLKGMKGYQLTLSDLEFIEKMKEEKLMKKLQVDLEELQRTLKAEMLLLERASASRVKAQTELEELPSCDDLTDWMRSVFVMTSPSTDLTGLDARSLLTMVTEENIQRAAEGKKVELRRLEKMVVKKKEREAEERGRLEKQIAGEQLKIHGLMRELSKLKSEVEQQEKVADASEELQAAKTPEKRGGRGRGRGRNKAVKSTETTTGSQKGEEEQRKKQTVRGRGRGRGRPAGQPTEEEEEAQSTALRRSKRIASRK